MQQKCVCFVHTLRSAVQTQTFNTAQFLCFGQGLLAMCLHWQGCPWLLANALIQSFLCDTSDSVLASPRDGVGRNMPTRGTKAVAGSAAFTGCAPNLLSLQGQFCPLQLCEWVLSWSVPSIFIFVSSTVSEYPPKHRPQVNKPSCLALFTLYWHLCWPKEQKKIAGHIWGLIKHCKRESFLSCYKHLLEMHLLI